ncbi:MAG: hypothetical protein H6Q58_1195 [Firmicutes bacterium]|nr:hypothetical protein [Bacillota bacterium]
MKTNFFNRDNMIDLLFTLIGGVLCAVSVNMFLVNAKLLSGGITGIALITQYLFKFPAGYMILILNIPLFLLSLFKLERKFTIYSFVGILTFTSAMILTRPVSNILNINDPLLYCLYGGVINGIGGGLVFAHNGSLGGFDIIVMLIKKKYTNFKVGQISFGINLVMVAFGAVVFGLPSALYTLIAMYTASFVLDRVVKGLNQSKAIFIITDREEEIADAIMARLGRGVTYLYGEGAYTKQQKKVLYCIVPLSQLPELKEIVTDADNRAFISISDASEIQGKGFKKTL